MPFTQRIQRREQSANLNDLGQFASIGTAIAEEPVPSEAVKVTIDIYSGLPNPVFYISKADLDSINELKNAFADASKTSKRMAGNTVQPSRLGYRGIFVENRTRVSGLPGTMSIYRNAINANEDASVIFEDNKNVEVFLLNKARENGVISQEVFERIVGDFQQGNE